MVLREFPSLSLNTDEIKMEGKVIHTKEKKKKSLFKAIHEFGLTKLVFILKVFHEKKKIGDI